MANSGKILAILSMFSGFKGKTYGRTVANNSLFEALLQYSSFRAIHLFYGEKSEAAEFEAAWRPLVTHFKREVQLFPISALPYNHSLYHYTVCFQPDMMLNSLIEVRNHQMPDLPVCGLTHSISYPRIMADLGQSMLSGLYSGDGIMCTTPTAETVIQKAMGDFKIRFQERFQCTATGFQTRVIPLGCPVALPPESRSKNRELARSALQLESACFLGLLIGRFSVHSKYDLLPLIVKASQIRDTLGQTCLIIAGDNSDSDYRDAMQSVITQLGMTSMFRLMADITTEQKHLLYQAADVFISPSDNVQETFGMSLLEAMAYELPVIASDWDGYRALIDPDCGILVPTWFPDSGYDGNAIHPLQYERTSHFEQAQLTTVDMDALFQTLLQLKHNPAQAALLGANGRQKVQRDFRWESIIPEMEKFWDNLAKATPKPIQKPLFQPNWNSVFQHYPRTLYSPLSTPFRLTPLGEAAALRTFPIFIYEDLQDRLNESLIHYLLERMMHAREYSISNQLCVLTAKFQVSAETVENTVAWLFKHQLISRI